MLSQNNYCTLPTNDERRLDNQFWSWACTTQSEIRITFQLSLWIKFYLLCGEQILFWLQTLPKYFSPTASKNSRSILHCSTNENWKYGPLSINLCLEVFKNDVWFFMSDKMWASKCIRQYYNIPGFYTYVDFLNKGIYIFCILVVKSDSWTVVSIDTDTILW